MKIRRIALASGLVALAGTGFVLAPADADAGAPYCQYDASGSKVYVFSTVAKRHTSHAEVLTKTGKFGKAKGHRDSRGVTNITIRVKGAHSLSQSKIAAVTYNGKVCETT